MALKRAVGIEFNLTAQSTTFLGTFTTDAASELDVLGHDGDTLGVDGGQVGVFEEANQVGFRRFLECQHGRGLEAQVGLEVLGDLTDEALEGELADEQLGRLLVAADFTKGDGTRAVAMGLLHASGSRGGLAGGLGGELFAWGLSTSGFTSGLLGTSHLGS